jgi:4-amino-4-deoxy-L-arabinose transferase-like glycosyltransferase
VLFAVALIASHASLLRLPYYWDEAGYYIPAARDLFAGSLIPHSTPSNAHPPIVMAWIALCWKFFGQSIFVTRCAMLLLAAFSLLGYFRFARTVANTTVAAYSAVLVAIYPVFFAQSSLAQIDLPSAGLIFWGLETYFQSYRPKWEAEAISPGRTWPAILWFSLAALAKETAILVPLALLLSRAFCRRWNPAPNVCRTGVALADEKSAVSLLRPRISAETPSLLIPVIPLALWYSYHYARTGHVFGNPEFFRYNVQATLHPLRIFLALLLRTWQTFGYLDLYVLTIACIAAMMFQPIKEREGERPRIEISIQFDFLIIILLYLVALSVVGGAVLARYMLPVVPLVILICVSTIWRRLSAWKAVIAIVALAFISALFVNPPYGFAPEDNLAYGDYIRLHQHAEGRVAQQYPNARVLTAWPGSDELTRPYLGYVQKPLQVVRIDDFSAEQLLSAADARSRFDVALVFSTKYQPRSIFDRWRLWQEWKSRYFDYHVDLTPEAAASVLGGNLVYVERRRGQWVGIIVIEKIEEAQLR